MEQDPHETSTQKERSHDQSLVETAIKPIQSPKDTGEREPVSYRNMVQH